MQKLKISKSPRKTEKPQIEPKYVDAKALGSVVVHDACFDAGYNPVCPNCGTYRCKCIDYGIAGPGEGYYFTNVCLRCNTVFTYKSTRAMYLRG
jgi:hypothetical protein